MFRRCLACVQVLSWECRCDVFLTVCQWCPCGMAVVLWWFWCCPGDVLAVSYGVLVVD